MFRKWTKDGTPFVIAEVGQNHNGDLELAKEYIRLLAHAGADAVKFQFIKPEKLINPKNNDIRIKQLKKFCLSWEQILKLKTYSKKINIIFLCSIFDLETLKQNKKKFAALKIPSGDNNIFD